MTEGKKIGQWLVGIVLLFLFLVTAFIPWITLSGDDYVDAAVNVHEYAREQDAVVADAAGAFTFISSYQKDSDLRNAWVVSYEKGIKSIISRALCETPVNDCKKLKNENGDDGYVVRAANQILILLPDEPEQIESIMQGPLRKYIMANSVMQ